VTIMECRSCFEALTAYMDGELGSKDSEQVELHLSKCSPCSEEFQSLRFSYHLFEKLSAIEVREDLWERVVSDAAPSPPPAHGRPRFQFPSLSWLPYAAGFAVVALVAVFSFNTANPTEDVHESFARFLVEREAVAIRNVNLFERSIRSGRNSTMYNPFVQRIDHSIQNPFAQE
jgi:anti-sigma factor RsiW